MSELHPGIIERTFNGGEVSLNYAEVPANGAPLVLLHGLGRRWQVFLPLIPALSLRWHIFGIDLRGHGKSGRVARGYRMREYGEDVARLLRERVPQPAVVFGHSLGGMVGMWLAANHPGLVRALILGDNPIVRGRGVRNPMYAALFTGLRDVARRGGGLEGSRKESAKLFCRCRGRKNRLRSRNCRVTTRHICARGRHACSMPIRRFTT